MKKCRNTKKTLEKIGKKWHNFDLKSEKTIYCYLCCIRVGKCKLRKLDYDLRFESYLQWKKYVAYKYQNFDIDELIEFSRYLNQRIRIIKPSHEYLVITITAVISALFTRLIDSYANMQIDSINLSMVNIIRIVLFLILIFIIVLFFAIQMLMPILQNDVEKNFLSDYKEIIDEMINEKIRK